LLVKVNDGFGVAAGTVLVAFRFQVFSQLGVVVDLAVENDPDIAILVGNRLMAALDVDDAQAAHGKADVFFDEEALIVGAAMRDAAVHTCEDVARNAPVAISKKDSADSAHIEIVSSGRLYWHRESVDQRLPGLTVRGHGFRIA